MDFSPLAEFMDRLTGWIVPGNAAAVYRDGRLVFSYASGLSDVENARPMLGGELFNIWSCSKLTTVTAALQLYERGFFLLDDPIAEYLPAWRDAAVKEPDGGTRPPARPLTVRHLFTMTAGLTYDTDTPAFERARALTSGRMDTVTVANCLAAEPLAFDPGEHWRYSLCHDVLAALVEVVSGERFADYVRRHIWEPLDMRNSTYHPDASDEALMAEQYIWNVSSGGTVELQRSGKRENGVLRNAGKGVHLRFGPDYDSGGAGITTSVDDYARFAGALANGGIGPTGERILAPGTIELMRTNQLTSAQLADFNWNQFVGCGYGLGVRTTLDRAAAGFNGPRCEFGWGGAAGATVIVDPETRTGLFYAHHMLNPQEEYYQPRLRNVLYACL